MLPKGIKDEFVRATSVSSQTNAAVRMRDGTVLRADVYRPAGAGRFPTLLQRFRTGSTLRDTGVCILIRCGRWIGATPWLSKTFAGGTLRMGNGCPSSTRLKTGSIRLTG